MADWVLKGSLKGPQGDPGADAQLPEGGTTGDFLQKTADGTGWFNSDGLLRASYVGTLQQIGDAGQSLEIHDVSVTSNGYVAGVSTDNSPEDGAFVYADDKNSPHLGHNRVGVLNGIPYVDLDTTDATGENGHLAADGRYSYVDDIEAADAAKEQGEALTIPTGAAVKQYVADHAGDALPTGGTTGQVLTKTASGEEWADVPAPDMTGVVKTDSDGKVIAGGSNTVISFENESNYARIGSSTGGSLTLHTQSGLAKSRVESSDGNFAEMTAQYDIGARIWTNGSLRMGSKTVTSITDSISASPAGNALTTDKAVADYVAANAGGGGLELLWEGDTPSGMTINTNKKYGAVILVIGSSGSYSNVVVTESMNNTSSGAIYAPVYQYENLQWAKFNFSSTETSLRIESVSSYRIVRVYGIPSGGGSSS